MNNQTTKVLAQGVLIVTFILLAAFAPNPEHLNVHKNPRKGLNKEVFNILEAKCNTCHRKQNPFMVFSIKNMERRAHKIHKQVFLTKRMPKGNQIQLSKTEYAILKKWLIQQNIQ